MLDEMETKIKDVKNGKEIGEPKPYICSICLAYTIDVSLLFASPYLEMD